MNKYLEIEPLISKTIEVGSEFEEIKFEALVMDVINSDVPITFTIGTGGSIDGRPTIHKGILYFSSYDHKCYAVDAKKGKEMWRFSTNDMISGVPAIYKDNICFGSFDGNVYMLNPDGKLLWKTPVNSPVAMSLLVEDDMLFFGDKNGKFYEMSAINGNILWTFPTKDSIGIGKPAFYSNKIYFGSYDHSFYCLSIDEKLIWKFPTKGPIDCCIVNVTDGVVYFGSFDKCMYALDAETGKLIWKTETNKAKTSATVYKDTSYFVGNDQSMYAVDIKTGRIKWKFNTKTYVYYPPTIYEDIIYLGSYDKNLYALDLNGKLLWKKETDDIIISPVYYDGTLYCSAWTCKLIAFDMEGNIVWKFPTSMTKVSDVDIEMARLEKKKIVLKPQEIETKAEKKYKNVSVGYTTSGTPYASAISTSYISKKKGYIS